MMAALAREAVLVTRAAGYELRKATAFRTGFLVREVLRGLSRPAVMILIYAAILRRGETPAIGTWDFPDLVAYMILVATFQKLVFHERALDLSEQIFEGWITKYLVMPVRYRTLAMGRWVQFVSVQLVVSATFYGAGLVLVPGWWPRPVSPAAALEALALVLLGTWCFFSFYFILNALAFWLDVVWSLLVMARFVTLFVAGTLIPISIFPHSARDAIAWLFPYWTLSAPIEIWMGRLGHEAFARGACVLAGSGLALWLLARLVWQRGTRRYAGSGM